jgi:predicted nucleic acid-binding protein
MIYADTDFFLALLKKDDWLKDRAEDIYRKNKRRIWTSPVTIIEMLLLAEEYKLDPERVVVDILEIAEVKGVDINILLLASHLMKHKNLNPLLPKKLR